MSPWASQTPSHNTAMAQTVKLKLVEVSPPRRDCWHLCLPEQAWLTEQRILEPASCPCSQTHSPVGCGSQEISPTSQSPHLECWTYSPPEFPPGTINLSFSYYFLCQLGGIKTPNTYTDLFSPEGIWSSLLSLEGTSISHYKVPD